MFSFRIVTNAQGFEWLLTGELFSPDGVE